MSDSPPPSAPVASAPRRRPGNAKRYIVVALVVAAAVAFLLVKGLGDATMFFRTVDEAAAQREQLGTRRFRLEGTVVSGSIKQNGNFTDFVVASKGITIPVRNQGQPLGIFQDNIPVVLEGSFVSNSDTFMSDRVMVKHTSDYKAKHPDRVSGAANS